MILLSQELPLSISLDQNTYRNAAQFARAGFEAAECCLQMCIRDRSKPNEAGSTASELASAVVRPC